MSEKVFKFAEESGVSRQDAALMLNKGMTEAVMAKAQAAGIKLSDLWPLFLQFGPVVFKLLESILGIMKVEKPADVEVEKPLTPVQPDESVPHEAAPEKAKAKPVKV